MSLTLGLLFFIQLLTSVLGICPCSNPYLCKPVSKQYKKELVTFGGSPGWKSWNWTGITNLVALCDLTATDCKELYCYAHSQGVRVTKLVSVGQNEFVKLTNATFRHQITDSWLAWVENYYLDGINIDIEGSTHARDVRQGITDLTNETYQALKKLNPLYTVTWDIPFNPYALRCVDSFCFDYVSLAQCTDYMILMDYDMIAGGAVASANSPYPLVEIGFKHYIKNLSINPNHLVMATPWYGYDFTCTNFFNSTGDNLCVVQSHVQQSFMNIMALVPQNIGGLKWDKTAESPFFTMKQDGIYHQLWFDNVYSLSIKYKLAVQLGLRGLGMWTADKLNYLSSNPKIMKQTHDMWDAITAYDLML